MPILHISLLSPRFALLFFHFVDTPQHRPVAMALAMPLVLLIMTHTTGPLCITFTETQLEVGGKAPPPPLVCPN